MTMNDNYSGSTDNLRRDPRRGFRERTSVVPEATANCPATSCYRNRDRMGNLQRLVPIVQEPGSAIGFIDSMTSMTSRAVPLEVKFVAPSRTMTRSCDGTTTAR